MLHVAPDMVRRELVGDDAAPRRVRYLVRPVPESLQTRAGVVYRASGASAGIGDRLMTEIVTNLVEAVQLELA